MSPSRLVTLVGLLGLAGCGGTVETKPPNTGTCPAGAPTPDTECDLADMTSCSYSGQGCSQVFQCEPVYPEAGAPSKWRVVTDECGQYCAKGPLCPAGNSQISSCPSSVACTSGVDPCRGPFACVACPPVAPDQSSECGPSGASCSLPWADDPTCGSSFTCGSNGLWSWQGDYCQ